MKHAVIMREFAVHVTYPDVKTDSTMNRKSLDGSLRA